MIIKNMNNLQAAREAMEKLSEKTKVSKKTVKQEKSIENKLDFLETDPKKYVDETRTSIENRFPESSAHCYKIEIRLVTTMKEISKEKLDALIRRRPTSSSEK